MASVSITAQGPGVPVSLVLVTYTGFSLSVLFSVSADLAGGPADDEDDDKGVEVLVVGFGGEGAGCFNTSGIDMIINTVKLTMQIIFM